MTKSPREAEKGLGNVSASRSDSAESHVRIRVRPLLPLCVHRVSYGCDVHCNRLGSLKA